MVCWTHQQHQEYGSMIQGMCRILYSTSTTNDRLSFASISLAKSWTGPVPFEWSELPPGCPLLFQIPRSGPAILDRIVIALKTLFLSHGIPEVVRSDNGAQFDSEVMLTFADSYCWES